MTSARVQVCEGIPGTYIVSLPSVGSVGSVVSVASVVRVVNVASVGSVWDLNEVVGIPIRSSIGYCLDLGLDNQDHVDVDDVNDTDDRQHCSVNMPHNVFVWIENRDEWDRPFPTFVKILIVRWDGCHIEL